MRRRSTSLGAVVRPPISPTRWSPPPPDPAFPDPLPQLQILEVLGHGPEDVLIDSDGSVLTGVADGRILRLQPSGRSVAVLADTGGRPLGLEWLPDRSLLVCDALRGLLSVDLADGTVTELTPEIPLRFCNNAAVASDGTVYFTDSSRNFGIDDWMGDLLEHGGTGRFLRRAPDGTVDTLLDGLNFPNGVALTTGGDAVIVADMAAYRLLRYWVRGPRTGQCEVFVDRLPGFVDNISTGTDGRIWLAMANGRDALLDRLLPRSPWLRTLVWALPDRLKPGPEAVVWVRAIDERDGRLVHDFRRRHPQLATVTGVREQAGRVWLGSLVGNVVGGFDLPDETGG